MVRQTVTDVGPPHPGFPFPVGPPASSLTATKIPTTLRFDVLVAIRATRNLEDNMLPVNYRS